jgi:hypothetical protein
MKTLRVRRLSQAMLKVSSTRLSTHAEPLSCILKALMWPTAFGR